MLQLLKQESEQLVIESKNKFDDADKGTTNLITWYDKIDTEGSIERD